MQIIPNMNGPVKAAGGSSEPSNFVDVVGGDPAFSLHPSNPVDWTDPNGLLTTGTNVLPYTVDGRYSFTIPVSTGTDLFNGGGASTPLRVTRIRMNDVTTFSQRIRQQNVWDELTMWEGAALTSCPEVALDRNAKFENPYFPEITSMTIGLILYNNAAMTSWNFDKLQSVGTTGLNVRNCNGMTEFNLPVFESCLGTIRGYQWSNATSINLPLMQTIVGDFDMYDSGYQTINIDALSSVGGETDFSGCAFSQSAVDYILEIYATNVFGFPVISTSKDLDISGGTNAVPSATGLAHKATLEADGWTVTVNS